MKIYITGASGMVGNNLLENENICRHQIITSSSKELNLLDYNAVKAFLQANKPDMIIHCAGKVGGIQANMQDMYGFFSQNLGMGVNLVNAAKEVGVRQFLNLGSSCIYPKDYQNPLKEEYIFRAPLEPTNEGYALAKLSVLKLCEYVCGQFEGFEYKTLMPCNLYGRFDKFSPENSHMIPSVIRKIYLAKKNNDAEVQIWGDGMARREFMYAADLAAAVAKAVDNFSALPTIMNVGLGFDYTVNQYYEAVAKVIGWQGKFTHDLSKPVGMQQKLLDVSKQTAFGFKPQFDLEEGIKRTYQFYLEKYEND